MEKGKYHLPVLLKKSIDYLDIKPEGVYVDVTYGGGGHSREILSRLGEKGRLIAFDQDADAQKNLIDDPRLLFIPANFRFIHRYLRANGVEKLDGVLADLGVSSHQFDEGERGFSYRFNALLDMRMNQDDTKTAAKILNEYSAEELQAVLGNYGEVRNAKTLAQAIIGARTLHPIQTIKDFLIIVEPHIRGKKERYLSQLFQALRIEVNDEIGALQDFLKGSFDALKVGGRLVVISYHSLEDRIVKNYFKKGNFESNFVTDFYGNIYRPFIEIEKKAIEPDSNETRENPRARSAKMRVAEKLDSDFLL